MDRGGQPRERHFTFSCSPLIADGGDVYGVLCAVAETAEFRLPLTAGLVELDAALQHTDSIAGILAAVLNSSSGSGDSAAVAIGVVDGDEVRFSYAGAFPVELRDRFHVAQMDSPLLGVDVARTGEPMIVTDTFELPSRYQHAVQYSAGSVRACVAYPLRDGAARVIGVLLLLWPSPRVFEPNELETFRRTAEFTQSTLERVRLITREHRIAVDFQEQLLDLDRGSMVGVIAAVYQPADQPMRVGGDWFSVTPLNSVGRIGISVGDVVGHGLPAAIVMSRLRAAMAASVLTLADPAEVLRALDTYAATIAGAGCATVAYATIGHGVINYSCAGHPYPLVVLPDGETVFLASGRRPPVGTRGYRAYDPAAEADLPPGSMVLLYTDGLVERPGEALAVGFARLKTAAAGCANLPVEAVCAELLRRMSPPGGYGDDVVVLALRPSHAGPHSFATVVSAVPAEVPVARQQVNDWLKAIAVQPDRADEILLATGEAVSNAIEHGSNGDGRDTVSVEGFLYRDTVAVTVSDSGSWAGDSSASLRGRRRGRGLTMISGFADRVDTNRTAAGTRVTLQFDKAIADAGG
ncbi:SpoIIE family protein phosphatase [Mycobacterium intermedium]|nr:SpoIIE family protein phosphatase [Mycobacterium intermedium]